MDRRSFLTLTTAGAAGLLASGGALLGSAVRFLFPSVYYEPPQKFKVGYAKDSPIGIPTFLPQEKIYIFRDEAKGFSAASAVCTHLGCTVQWFANDQRFHCPCHGSVFSADGAVVHGPAPKPLQWIEVTLAKDGQLQVDKNRSVADSYHLILPS